MTTLCRAFVSLPDSLCERDRPLQERTVFFNLPGLGRFGAATHLEQLLATVWGIDTTNWAHHGCIYNISTEQELADEWSTGGAATGDMRLLETGSGGTHGVIVPGSDAGDIRIHYARRANVDLFLPPTTAARLQAAMDRIEALYAVQPGSAW